MRDRKQRKYGQDQPWREERRHRYPDEPYGGEREWRSNADERHSHRGRGWEANQDWRAQGNRGADYRRDFAGPETYGEHDFDRDRVMDWNESRWNRGASFGFGPDEDIERAGNYAYGSPYGQGDPGSDRMGRGDWNEPRQWTNPRDWSTRGDRAGRNWPDTDWMPNRPARGRGGWAGDWSTPASADPAIMGHSDNYTGRGPKDYRRSDDRIREEVCDLFTDDWRLDASEVTVKVEGAEVVLTGTVTTRDQKRRAEEIAERVRGVGDVHNQIRVMRGESTTGTSPSGNQQPPIGGRGSRASGSQQQGIAHDRDRER
jgi:hypothetical protein